MAFQIVQPFKMNWHNLVNKKNISVSPIEDPNISMFVEKIVKDSNNPKQAIVFFKGGSFTVDLNTKVLINKDV